ncbi:hypothetical protein LOZ52_004779 [Ophidiomyces ophidiicola]|nr:hypothetical protein LOZ49_003060 [Ophidiomyces ophidiicola]KAI2020946.1 hypothetical protein LOZ46_002561 [Ophidiomyces ophidiicola]KAI2142478.1 hypothetical protein LOZ28_002174 [Ophidiomyces ophidiicola]KAI2144083.1 hypothetical protein LOZ29_000885 [Ophidiomyces ophidiicola]KAI2215519.1 hypothetical protein LOZ15_004493 [Ophidiomyces ophidiicola]
MAFNKKYAGLPDLDLAPDIYETPELTDDSTLPTATVRSSSPFPEETSTAGIDRQRLQPDHARSQFEPVRVDASGVDFSDSLASRRKSYRTVRRSRRRRDDGTEVLGDTSEDEDESLERKLARLRRETEELKNEIANRNSQSGEREEEDENELSQKSILELNKTLNTLYISSKGGQGSSEEAFTRQLATGIHIPKSERADETPAAQQLGGIPSSLLANTASFDARLTLLEAALGLSQTPISVSPDDPSDSDLPPILPTLRHLSSQLSTLTSTLTNTASSGPAAIPSTLTTPHLEALTTRIRKLTADAEALTVARRRATDAARAVLAARIAAGTSDEPPEIPAAAAQATPTEIEAAASEQASKIQALYTTLPTITSLHPLLPSVLERLRSLRVIHAGAASASEDLEVLEKRQGEMRKEIDQWREGLAAMEERIKESEASMKRNVDVVGPWVKGLETRLDALD